MLFATSLNFAGVGDGTIAVAGLNDSGFAPIGRKVAISQGFRLAFPAELGGMPYTPEELIDKPGITGKSSEDLSKGKYIEGEVVPDAFQAPAGMDDMPGSVPAPDPINVDGLAGFMKGVADLAELEAEYKTIRASPRWACSDQKAINAIFTVRKGELKAQ